MTELVAVKQSSRRLTNRRVRGQRDFEALEHRRMRAADLIDVWTFPRVAEMIEHVTGVSYPPGHVWYILRDRLDWTWQRPARRATERNDAAIERWVKQRWPQLKKGHGARTHC